MKWLLHLCFCYYFLFYYFEQAHFVFVSGLLFFLFVKLLVVFEKLKNIAIYFYVHTIQPTLLVFKIAPFFFFFFLCFA